MDYDAHFREKLYCRQRMRLYPRHSKQLRVEQDMGIQIARKKLAARTAALFSRVRMRILAAIRFSLQHGGVRRLKQVPRTVLGTFHFRRYKFHFQ